MATSYDCKYTEVSASLDHNVDELLVGILTQIRLKSAEKTRFGGRGGGGAAGGGRKTSRSPRGLAASLSGGGSLGGGGGGGGLSPNLGGVPRRKSAGIRVKGILDKMMGGDSKSKSCDDLHVL